MATVSSISARCNAPRSASEYTPMQWIPISRAVRATRIAISPRFAIRSRRNIGSPSQRDVAVLLGRPALSFRAEDREGAHHTRPGLGRFSDAREDAYPRRHVRVGD